MSFANHLYLSGKVISRGKTWFTIEATSKLGKEYPSRLEINGLTESLKPGDTFTLFVFKRLVYRKMFYYPLDYEKYKEEIVENAWRGITDEWERSKTLDAKLVRKIYKCGCSRYDKEIAEMMKKQKEGI